MAKFQTLLVWQKADELAFEIYKATDAFPGREIFGLTAQLRRAAVSVPANIAEGYNRKSKREFSRFIDIALGSLAETEYLLMFFKRLGYVEDCKNTERLISEVGKLLWSFQKSLAQARKH